MTTDAVVDLGRLLIMQSSRSGEHQRLDQSCTQYKWKRDDVNRIMDHE